MPPLTSNQRNFRTVCSNHLRKNNNVKTLTHA